MKDHINYTKATRVEVIDQEGRVYNAYNLKSVAVSLQDAGQTLKIFVYDKDKE